MLLARPSSLATPVESQNWKVCGSDVDQLSSRPAVRAGEDLDDEHLLSLPGFPGTPSHHGK